MELRHLRYFIAAAEAQSFRKAAEQLHVVQPALSKQIAALEEDLGVLLFERVKQRVKLTAAGESYLADARWILREVQFAGERAVRIATGKVGVLRVGFHETAGRSRIVSDSFRDFRRSYPDIELRLLQMTSPVQLDAIEHGNLDAGYIYMPATLPADLASRVLGEHRIYLALHKRHSLAKKREIIVRDLADEPFVGIARSVNPAYYDALASACRLAGLVPNVVQETQSEATTMNLVAVGLGLALVVSADDESWTRDVVIRPVRDIDFTMSLALVWQTSGAQVLTQRLVDTLDALSRS